MIPPCAKLSTVTVLLLSSSRSSSVTIHQQLSDSNNHHISSFIAHSALDTLYVYSPVHFNFCPVPMCTHILKMVTNSLVMMMTVALSISDENNQRRGTLRPV